MTCIAAGTSRVRMITTSTVIAMIIPTPIIWMNVIPEKENNPTTTRSRAAAVMTSPPVFCRPIATEPPVVSRQVVLFSDPGEHEHLVVHRQSEQDREDEDERGGIERAGGGEAQRAGQVPLLEDPHERTEGHRDRKQVHQCGLQRHDDGSEGQ